MSYCDCGTQTVCACHTLVVPTHLPLGIGVLQQLSLVRAREHHQTPIATVNPLHGCPGAYNLVRWTERKIPEVLVVWVAGGLVPCVRRFVDEHGVHGHDVPTDQCLDYVQHSWVAAVLRENRVQLKVLYLVDRVLAPSVAQTGYVLHYSHEWWPFLRVANLLEALAVLFQLATLVQALYYNKAIPVVKVKIVLRQSKLFTRNKSCRSGTQHRVASQVAFYYFETFGSHFLLFTNEGVPEGVACMQMCPYVCSQVTCGTGHAVAT